MELKKELLAKMFYRMNQSRFFDMKVNALYNQKRIAENIHLSVGQEASAIAACLAMDKGDKILMTHRHHAQAIGSGMEVHKMMADLLGKAGGYNGGKGGTAFICDGVNLGAFNQPDMSYTMACGVALTQKMIGSGNIVLCFGGDGTSNDGDFHEALNLASVSKLPVLFMIENNGYSGSTPVAKTMKPKKISDRALAYGIPGITIDGNDALEVYETVKSSADLVRNGEGPVLIESFTYRTCGHDGHDLQLYRSQNEVTEWAGYDPINLLKEQLIEERILPESILEKLAENAENSVEDALSYAEQAPEPIMDSVVEHIFV